MIFNSIHPEVWVAPPVAFIVQWCVCYLRGLDRQLSLQGVDFLLKLADCLLHCHHCRVLGGHMIWILCHLCCQFQIGASDVSHCRPVLRCCLCKVFKVFLYSNQVVGYVATLARCLLPLSEVGLSFNGVGLEVRPRFFGLCPPRPTHFRVLTYLRYQSVGNADDMGFWDRLACCRCKVCTFVDPLDEALDRLLCVVWWSQALIIVCHVCGGDASVVCTEIMYQLNFRLCSLPRVRMFQREEVGVVEGWDEFFFKSVSEILQSSYILLCFLCYQRRRFSSTGILHSRTVAILPMLGRRKKAVLDIQLYFFGRRMSLR